MTEAAFWWVNTVSVETFTGSGSHGPAWAAPVTVNCWVEDGTQMVRDSQGNETVSSTAIHGPLGLAAMFAVGSKVTTVGKAGASQVLTLDRFDSGTLGLKLEHFVARLK